MKSDKRVEHLAVLIQKVGFLEYRIEEIGDQRGHLGREVAAISWAIESLRDLDPDLAALLPRAEAIAENKLARARQVPAHKPAG